MNKTKRHTTFRTSVGTKVYVEAPEVYVAPGITPEDLKAVWQSGGAGRQALKETLASRIAKVPATVIPAFKYQGCNAIGQLDYDADRDRLLISGFTSGKVFEVDMEGNLTWELTGLNTPNTAYYLGDGTVLIDVENPSYSPLYKPDVAPKLIRVRMSDKSIIWSLDLPLGSDPQAAFPLPNPLEWDGRVLITYRSYPGRNPRIVEIDEKGNELWSYEPTTPTLKTPCFAFRMPAANGAIFADFRHRVLVVDSNGNVRFQYGVTDRPGMGHNRLNTPESVVSDLRQKLPKLFISDWGNDRIICWYPNFNRWTYLPFIIPSVSGLVYNPARDTLFACSNAYLTIYELPVIEVEKPFFFETVSDKLWDNESISASSVTDAYICKGYKRKTIYFLTDTDGDITVEIDPDGNGNWMTLYSESAIGVRNATNPWMFSTEYEFWQLRVKFSAAATVSCWVALGD